MIPTCFHRIWLGGAMPPLFREFGETWRDLHPGWKWREWNEENLPPLANQELFDRASEIAPGFEGQLRSDVARYEILHRFGGVYIDTDYECFKPIDPLLADVECFCAWEIQDQVANNAILGCEPGHPFMERLVERLPDSIRSSASKRPSKISGPHFLTVELRRNASGVIVFPQAWFYAIGCKELDRLSGPPRPDEYCRHWWANQHRLRGKRL